MQNTPIEANEVHPEAQRILRRYRTMTPREVRRAGPQWIRAVRHHEDHCYECGAAAVEAIAYEAVRGPQPNVVLERGFCHACGHSYEYDVSDVPNTGCNPCQWAPPTAT